MDSALIAEFCCQQVCAQVGRQVAPLERVVLSHHDLFHLSCACLHPPPCVSHLSPLSPMYLYLHFLLVCCQFVLSC
jgi:hypothetical protein